MANHKKLRKMAFAKKVIPRSDMVLHFGKRSDRRISTIFRKKNWSDTLVNGRIVGSSDCRTDPTIRRSDRLLTPAKYRQISKSPGQSRLQLQLIEKKNEKKI